MHLTRNAALGHLNGFSSLQSIQGYLRIWDNDALGDIDGLSSLTTVGAWVEILDNEVLHDVDGLSSLTAVPNWLSVADNSTLRDVGGLSNLATVGGSLGFRNNPQSDCCGLFTVLEGSGVGGIVLLSGNDASCSTVQQIVQGGPCATAMEETTWTTMKRRYQE